MTRMLSRKSNSRWTVTRTLFAAAVVVAGLTGIASAPARADGWHDHGGFARHEWREHEWREHEWRLHHPYGYGYGYYGYAPSYYAPPPVVYAPPPPPSLSVVIPFR